MSDWEDTNAIPAGAIRLASNLREENKKLEQKLKYAIEGLRELRLEHHVCDGDCWFSCPKSGECCDEDKDPDHCNCGADAHNARIENLITKLETD